MWYISMMYSSQIAYLLNWSFNRQNKLPRYMQTFLQGESYKYLWQEIFFKLKIWNYKSRTHQLRKTDTNKTRLYVNCGFEINLSPSGLLLKDGNFLFKKSNQWHRLLRHLLSISHRYFYRVLIFFRLWCLRLSFALTPVGQKLMNHYATCLLR